MGKDDELGKMVASINYFLLKREAASKRLLIGFIVNKIPA